MPTVGDIGTRFKAIIVAPTEKDPNARMRLEAAVCTFKFRHPNGVVTGHLGTVTNAAKGEVEYVVDAAAFFAEVGVWEWQVQVVVIVDAVVTGDWHTAVERFTVDDRFTVTP